MDDGQAIEELSGLIGGMLGTMLATLERNNVMGADSEVKNLGEVMALYFRIGTDKALAGMGFKPRSPTRRVAYIALAYSIKYNIALRSPVSLEPSLSKIHRVAQKTKLPAPEFRRNDPWNWAKVLREYQEDFRRPMYAFCPGPVGGDRLDITTWTSEKRMKHNYEDKDPISSADMENVKNGMVLDLA